MRRLLAAALFVCALVSCAKTPATIPGVIRLGEQEEPDSLNLMFAHTAAADEISALLFSSLLRYDANGNPFPDLATAVPTEANGGISPDGKTITLHLRRHVRWSDGAPLTAADWIFTYKAVLNPRNNTKTRYGWDKIASASAPDPYTLVIRLKKPSVEVLGIIGMGGAAYPPMPAHLLANLPDINHAAFNTAPISSGPYLLQTWNHGSSLIFVPNPTYWRGAPRVKQVIWKIIPDTNTLFSQLQTHEIDLYPSVDTGAIARLASIPGINVLHRPVANWRHLGMNLSRPLLADARVREAIALGIDWKRMNDTVYHGYNVLAVSDIFPQSWAAPTLPPYKFNPTRARALLAQAGWTMGSDGILRKGTTKLSLTVNATTSAKSNEQSELVMQSMLHALGIELLIRNYTPSLLFSQTGPVYTGKYDLEWSVETNGPDPENEGSWNSAFIPPAGANTSWLRDPVVDETSEAAATTYDEGARRKLYQREAARLRELNPAIFFYWETAYYGVNPAFKGFKPAAFLADTWNAWEWQI